MKLLHKSISAFILSSTLFSISAMAYSNEERIQDMQMMEQATQQMQKGFLYNNLQDIKDGAALLEKHAAKIEPPVTGNNTMKNSYAYGLTKREAKKIISYAKDAVKNYEEHKPKRAMNNFTKALKQCMTCHARIRKW